jgi:hypothetical protein
MMPPDQRSPSCASRRLQRRDSARDALRVSHSVSLALVALWPKCLSEFSPDFWPRVSHRVSHRVWAGDGSAPGMDRPLLPLSPPRSEFSRGRGDARSRCVPTCCERRAVLASGTDAGYTELMAHVMHLSSVAPRRHHAATALARPGDGANAQAGSDPWQLRPILP